MVEQQIATWTLAMAMNTGLMPAATSQSYPLNVSPNEKMFLNTSMHVNASMVISR